MYLEFFLIVNTFPSRPTTCRSRLPFPSCCRGRLMSTNRTTSSPPLDQRPNGPNQPNSKPTFVIFTPETP